MICPDCDGEGALFDGGSDPMWWDCMRCGGTGKVPFRLPPRKWHSLLETEPPLDVVCETKGGYLDPEQIVDDYFSSKMGDWMCQSGDPTHWRRKLPSEPRIWFDKPCRACGGEGTLCEHCLGRGKAWLNLDFNRPMQFHRMIALRLRRLELDAL